jgi:hypothetical protein
MPIAIACPGCSKRYDLADEFAGKTAKCKQCGQVFKIPVPAWAGAPKAPATLPERSSAPARPTPTRSAPLPAATRAPAPSPPSPVSAMLEEMDDEYEGEVAVAGAAVRRGRYRRHGNTRWVRPTLILCGLVAGLAAGVYGIYWAVTSVMARFAETGEGPSIARNPAVPDVGRGPLSTWPRLPEPQEEIYPSGTNPSARPKPPVRRDVVDSGVKMIRDTMGILRQITSTFASIRDASSAQAALPRLKSLAEGGQDIAARARSIRPTRAENREIVRLVEDDVRSTIEGLREQINRIQSMPGGAAGAMQMTMGINTLASGFENMARQAGPPDSERQPYVEVFIAGVPDGESGAILVEKLKPLVTGGNPGIQSNWESGYQATSARIWPVGDARSFAERIPFGRAEVSSYRIVVLKPSIDAQEVSAFTQRKRQEEEARKVEVAAREEEEKRRQELENQRPRPERTRPRSP